jgi:ABC-type multidrug transport system fused ATPase/permease subunit
MKEMTASKVFSSMSVFDTLLQQLHLMSLTIPRMVQGPSSSLNQKKNPVSEYGISLGKVSLNRINDFLTKVCCTISVVELITDYLLRRSYWILSQGKPTKEVIDVQQYANSIGFRDAIFSWSNASEGNLTPSRGQFCLHIEDELFFQPGRINLVVGPTDSGKTSLLVALLGEMHFMPTGPNSFFNLPRASGVAYAAQESWVQNDTIKVMR